MVDKKEIENVKQYSDGFRVRRVLRAEYADFMHDLTIERNAHAVCVVPAGAVAITPVQYEVTEFFVSWWEKV